MVYQCPVCLADPTSHSFRILNETDDVIYYYTCPAKASKYNDRDGILAHYDGELTQKGDKKWVWIFDSEGFDMIHALEVKLAIDMALLINGKHSASLEKICVINPTIFTSIIVNVIWPFLGYHLRSIIVYDSSQRFAISSEP
jgi:hypothetical protein